MEDDTEDDRLLPDNISTYASTVSNVLLFDQASPNYTTVLSSQISVTYQPNGTDTAKTAYIKNLGWHFARYNNTPYEDDPIYCIEPCKNYAASTSGNYMDQDLGVSGSGSSRGSNVWYAMPSSYRQAIALTLLYSKQLWNSNYSVKTTAMANNPNVSTRIATQFLIYEIVTGLRDASTFNRKSSNGYSSGDVFYNAGVANVSGFADKYNSIVSSVQSAMKIPSFTSRSSGSAPAITMSGSQVSVTDSNGVLGNFSFANGNGASFSKSGNTLTITKTGTISPSTVFSATRSLPSAENSTVSIYYSASSTYQTCVKLYSPQVETLRAYFKMLRHSYLRKHREGLYTGMLMEGTLNAHLEEVDREANRMLEQLTTQMALEQGVTEELKARDQMLWVQRMNNIRQAAEEIIYSQLIYA